MPVVTQPHPLAEVTKHTCFCVLQCTHCLIFYIYNVLKLKHILLVKDFIWGQNDITTTELESELNMILLKSGIE